MNKSILFTAIFAIYALSLKSQVITVDPPLPNDQSSVEVIFDASQGSGGLAGYTGEVYAHTGVITNLSTSSSDWKHVKADWGVNIPACKLTSLGNNLWKLVISPSIRSYYNVPASEEIQKMAFVFRSGVQVEGKWLEGKTAEGGDIFYDVFPSTLSVKITNPAEDFLFVTLNSTLNVEVSSLMADSTLLYINSQQVAATTSNLINYPVAASTYGRFLVKAVAKTSTAMVADSFYYYVRPAATVAELPAGMNDGINYLSDTSVLLSLYAPLKEFAFVIGDFNNWLPDEQSYMKRTPDSKRYWVQINGLVPGKEYIYQYMVDDNIRIGDPYAEKVSDPWNDQYIPANTYAGILPYPAGKTQGVATVLQTAQIPYVWKSGNFTPPKKTDLVIYELLVRDFSSPQNFQAVMDTIGYLWKLGVNAIELMPVNEFEGNLSWGYNTSFYFAVDKYYGPANKLKQLIDTCHQMGIAVISDIVLNHAFGTSPYVKLYWDKVNNQPLSSSPFYNPVAKHDFSVGYDMNHESASTKTYVGRILRYWLEEFRFDGYRFDLSKGLTQKNTLGNPNDMASYDQSRINIISAYYDTIKSVKPDAYLILEHFADNSEEKVLANKGMMLWGNMNNAYNQSAMGYNTDNDLSWGVYSYRGWSYPYLVTYMESHDEERQMFKCLKWGNAFGDYSVKDSATALKRAALAATFLYTIPGPKMLWQFGERGYDYSLYWPSGTESTKLNEKPSRWDYMKNGNRVYLYDIISSLIKLHKDNSIFETTDFDYSLTGLMKKIRLRNSNSSMVVLGNFDVKDGTITANFYNTGKYYEFFSGDSITVTSNDMNIDLKAGEYRIYTNTRLPFPYGIDDDMEKSSSVSVIPNPVNEMCTIEITYPESTNCRADVFTLEGKFVGTIYNGQISEKLSLAWVPPASGIYVLLVITGKQQTVKRIVVSR